MHIYYACSVFPGSVEADVGWGGNLNDRLMTTCVRNYPTKH